MVAGIGNSRSANSKLGQVTYLNTFSFHSCGFQFIVHTTPKSSTFRVSPYIYYDQAYIVGYNLNYPPR